MTTGHARITEPLPLVGLQMVREPTGMAYTTTRLTVKERKATEERNTALL